MVTFLLTFDAACVS